MTRCWKNVEKNFMSDSKFVHSKDVEKYLEFSSRSIVCIDNESRLIIWCMNIFWSLFLHLVHAQLLKSIFNCLQCLVTLSAQNQTLSLATVQMPWSAPPSPGQSICAWETMWDLEVEVVLLPGGFCIELSSIDKWPTEKIARLALIQVYEANYWYLYTR